MLFADSRDTELTCLMHLGAAAGKTRISQGATRSRQLPYMREWQKRESTRQRVRECVREQAEMIRQIVSAREQVLGCVEH